MEFTGTRLPSVGADDLAPVANAEGPFVTVYLPTPGGVENAAQRVETAWRSLRADLDRAGAPVAALGAIEAEVPDAHQAGHCLAAVATEGGLLHREHGPAAPPARVGRLAPLPSLAPILEWRQGSPPYVVVRADRTGADLTAAVPRGRPIDRTVEGTHDPHIHRGTPGGWSQRRYQQRAEEHWEDNAEAVAEEVATLVKRVRAELILVAGDVRAVGFLRDHLAADLAERVHEIEGGRGVGSDEDIDREAEEEVRAAVDRDTAAVLQAFREEAAQRDLAVEGAADTLGALSRAQVELVLVHDDPEDDRRAWFGPQPTHAAATPKPLEEMGVEPTPARLVDVVVRAALGTGAGIRVIPAEAGVADSVGGILRWTT
jgi:Bacterial archaeo-eukaryotic release factor family 2